MSDAEPVTPPKASPRSRSWLYEVPVFFALLLFAQRTLFAEDPAFRQVNPNPMWLGVMLFALRYGIGAGLSSGLVSAGLLAWGARAAGESYLLSDSDFYLQPGLFVLVGAALGGVADRFAYRLGTLRSRIEELAGRARGLQSQVLTQQKAMRAIEQQVVSQMSSVVTLYHGSRELDALDRGALLAAALDFFTKALQATGTSLYLPRGGRLELLDRRGWSDEDGHPRSVGIGEGVIGRAASERRAFSLRELPSAALEKGGTDAVMAAPLLEPSGELAAVFAVHAMPFLRFNSAALTLLTLLAEWGSESLAKCSRVEDLKSRSLLDEELAVHSAGYFERRAAQEFARSRRYALPFSVLLVGVSESPELPEDRRSGVARTVCRVLTECAREIDVVARAPFSEARFAVLLMTATREKAAEIARRVAESFAALELPASVKIGAGSYAASMKSHEEIIEQARSALR